MLEQDQEIHHLQDEVKRYQDARREAEMTRTDLDKLKENYMDDSRRHEEKVCRCQCCACLCIDGYDRSKEAAGKELPDAVAFTHVCCLILFTHIQAVSSDHDKL